MSIDELILDRVRRNMLWLLRPIARGARVGRTLLVTEGLWAILNSPEGDSAWEERIGKLQADLERFVTDEEPIDPKYLFLLYPSHDGVWEIRSVRDEPSIRVLGLFAKKDTFVATNHALREDLGGWQSREWRTVKRAARAAWSRVFGTYRPRPETNVHELVTGAHDGRYFKNHS